MKQKREPWYDSDNPDRVARALTGRLILWIIGAVVVVGAIGVGIWSFRVATSDIKGAGDATMKVNDGVNRINAQEWFHGQYAAITAADRQLDEAAANLRSNKGKPDETWYQTNYSGLKNRCLEMVATYNGESQKVSREQWRDPNLPARIDATDPATDCIESITEVTPR